MGTCHAPSVIQFDDHEVGLETDGLIVEVQPCRVVTTADRSAHHRQGVGHPAIEARGAAVAAVTEVPPRVAEAVRIGVVDRLQQYALYRVVGAVGTVRGLGQAVLLCMERRSRSRPRTAVVGVGSCSKVRVGTPRARYSSTRNAALTLRCSPSVVRSGHAGPRPVSPA